MPSVKVMTGCGSVIAVSTMPDTLLIGAIVRPSASATTVSGTVISVSGDPPSETRIRRFPAPLELKAPFTVTIRRPSMVGCFWTGRTVIAPSAVAVTLSCPTGVWPLSATSNERTRVPSSLSVARFPATAVIVGEVLPIQAVSIDCCCARVRLAQLAGGAPIAAIVPSSCGSPSTVLSSDSPAMNIRSTYCGPALVQSPAVVVANQSLTVTCDGVPSTRTSRSFEPETLLNHNSCRETSPY